MKLNRLLALAAIPVAIGAVAPTASASELPDCSGGRVVTRYYWRTDSLRPLGCDLDPPQTLSIRVPVRDFSDRPLERAYHVLMDYGCAAQARLVTIGDHHFEVGDRCDY